MGGWAVSKARSSAPTRGAHIPGVFQPPPSGSAYFGQAYRYELSQHYKQWVFVAISAWIREVAGGAPPKFGKRSVRDPSRPKSAPVRKALGGIQEHHEFEPYDDDDPICRVFSNPNGPDVAYDLWAYHTLFKKLTGEAHWWVRRNTFQVPKEIWVIPTHWMRMVVDGDGQPEHYAIQSPWGRLQDIPYDQVVSFREHSPLNRYEGTPVAQACAEWLDSYEALTRMRLAVWKNGGVPAFHVRLGESYMDPDDAFLSRFYGKWFSRFGGEDNSGKPLITGADVEMKAIEGHRPAEALQASNQSEEHIRDQVLAAFNVPKACVGLTDSMTYGSVTASQDAFRMFAVNAELTYTGQVITEKIVRTTPGHEDGVGYWEDRMAGDPDFKLRQEAQDLATGVKTVNQVKAARGDAPYEHGGDDPMVNGTVMPWATGKKAAATGLPPPGKPAPKPVSQEEPAEDGALRRAMGELTGAGGGYLLNGRGHGRN